MLYIWGKSNIINRKSVPELQSNSARSAEQVEVVIEDHGAVYRGEAKQGIYT